MIVINLKESFVPEIRMVLQRMGAGIKAEEPVKLTRPFLGGAAMLATSLAVVHSESSVTSGTMILQSASAVFKVI